MLRAIRKKLNKNKEIDDVFGSKWDKFYVENTFQKNKLFIYLLFLRKNKVNLNSFFDSFINKNSKPNKNNKTNE